MLALPASRLIAAPMAGGVSTVALARAVASAGGLPFLAAGYRSPDDVAREIDELSASVSVFGVNLFAPGAARVDRAAFRAYADQLAPDAARYGVVLDPEPVSDDDGWAAKLAVVRDRRVPVVSFTFALPAADEVAALQAAGSRVLATVTTAAEARAAAALGVDGLVVQGSAAGGHSAMVDPARAIGDTDLAALVAAVGRATGLPVIAAGGVDGPTSARHLLAAGAVAVAVGTAFLLADEAGTSAVHRAALVDPRFADTVVTRAFTGRPARALRNGFADRHSAAAPAAYPAVHHLTLPLRRAAAAAGDADGVHLWAGTGWRAARAAPAAAADIVEWLASG